MAKKTSKKPYKFRQARKDAKAATKDVFQGKKPSGRKAAVKDITTKQTLEEREALKELSDARKRQKAGKADFIVDDRGQKVFVKPTETAEERMARDRAAARRAAYEKYPLEEGEKKPAAKKRIVITKEDTEKVKKATAKKRIVVTKADTEKAKTAKAKPETKLTPAGEAVKKRMPGMSNAAANNLGANVKPGKMSRAEKSAANKAAWKNMSPAERKNWSANKPGVKPAPVQSVTNVQPEKAGKGTTKPKFVQKKTPAKKAVVKPSTSKELVVRPKGAVATTAKKAATTAAKKGGVAGVLKGAGRVAGKLVGGRVGAALAVGSMVAGPLHKALSKDTKGRTTFDVLQKRADAVVAADKKKQLPKRPAGALPKGGGKGATGSKLVTGTGVGAGGSSYTVKKGDTLSAIAKSNNTTLAAIREANPKLMKNKKYKQGNVIFSGTKVKLPKK